MHSFQRVDCSGLLMLDFVNKAGGTSADILYEIEIIGEGGSNGWKQVRTMQRFGQQGGDSEGGGVRGGSIDFVFRGRVIVRVITG